MSFILIFLLLLLNMTDYYRLLEVNYNDPIEVIIGACKRKLFEYKALPYLNNEDRGIQKLIKKSYYIFTNPEFKKKYDDFYIKNIQPNEIQNIDQNDILGDNFVNNYFEFPINNPEANTQFINDPVRNNQNHDMRSNKKSADNQNYLVDRIFNFQNTNNNYNIKDNELLRPKNVGLSSDDVIEFDKPIDYEESTDFLPYNFDS